MAWAETLKKFGLEMRSSTEGHWTEMQEEKRMLTARYNMIGEKIEVRKAS